MAERMRAAPDYVEPTAPEKALHLQEIEAWLRSWKQGQEFR